MNGQRPPQLRDVTGKLKRKKRKDLWRRVRWYVFGALGSAIVGLLVWLLWFSGVFVARSVEVSGTTLLTVDEVVAAAKIPLGTQLIRLDTRSPAERIGALPAVKSVSVTASWPSTVMIAVTERTAVYQRFDGAVYSWVDASGVAFHNQAEPMSGLVVAKTGTSDARLLRDVATVVGALSPELVQRIKEVGAASPDRIILMLDKGAQIVWGSADRSPFKAQVATALLKVEAKTIDVSAPENPITRR